MPQADVAGAVAALGRRYALPAVAVQQLLSLARIVERDPLAPTSVRDPSRTIDDHLADSLVALELEETRNAKAIADLGSGAGFPGLPLAISLPEATVALVESSARKCAFAGRAVSACALGNAYVVNARAETWPEGLSRFDLVTARAVARLAVVAEYAAPLLRVGGTLIAWRGRRARAAERAAAVAAAQLGLEMREPVRVQPYASAEHRHLQLMQKMSETPARFPRRPGIARKRPLGGRPAPARQTAAHHGKRTDLAAGKPLRSQGADEIATRLAALVASLVRTMGTVYAIANQKGGVGKTTTAVNLAACVAEAGYEALLIDIDPQCNATLGLGLGKDAPRTVYDVLVGSAALSDVIVATEIERLWIAPAGPDLAGATVELPRVPGSETRLRAALEPIRARYAFTLLDCPPSLGPLTVNALVAADRVIVPVQAEYFALEGLAGLLDTLSVVQRELNPRLTVAGMLLTMHDGRTRLAQDVEREVRAHFPHLVFDTVIPRNVRIGEAPSFGKPVIHHDPHCAGADAYFEFAKEVAARG